MRLLSIDVDNYLLWVIWCISLGTTVGVMNRFSPVWPLLPFVSYGLTAVGALLGTYLVSILGNLSYLMAKNRGMDALLEDSGNMEKFINALTEPTKWGHVAFITTAAYFIATFYGYASLIGALEMASVSTVITTYFAIVRNLHMIYSFTTATLRQNDVMSHMRAVFIHNLFSHIEQLEEKAARDTTVD